ncbi:putative non-specific serine/threonine protein kinase [Helianthus annuus]|uniref:Non-specific serine/threonine protein kinase n=1 Tax=Helianthus annuus TaxID=4232 RepID=A0A9K3JXV3_HELAN|nr:putative non-specific serine/threonine protein kinase [Helianthus annuus]
MCGAGVLNLYPFLCGTFPFDDKNIPNLFKKIKVLSKIVFYMETFKIFFESMETVVNYLKNILGCCSGWYTMIYTLPSYLSPGARDLTSGMLVVEGFDTFFWLISLSHLFVRISLFWMCLAMDFSDDLVLKTVR